jgi:hypothetical protein
MSGETEKDESGWTTDTLNYFLSARIGDLRALLDERYRAQSEALLTALRSTDKAITKVETATEARFASVNEFRATLADQQSQLLTRAEYDANHAALVEKISDLTDRFNLREGQHAGVRMSAGALTATITVAAAIVGIVTGLVVVLTR